MFAPSQPAIPNSSRPSKIIHDSSKSAVSPLPGTETDSASILIPILKSGWLRKQSGAFRRWRRRYFLLSESGHLSYFDREIPAGKLIGRIDLSQYKIEIPETSGNAAAGRDTENGQEMDRFDFTLKTVDGKSYDCVMSAESESDRKIWITALKKAIYRRKGGAVFGYPLSEIMASPEEIPAIVMDCCNFIRQYGLLETGIFRLSGRKKQVTELAESYDRGEPPIQMDLEHYDVHTVAGVLKKFLSELPEPLIPYDHYDRLKATGFYVYEGCEIPSVIEQLQRLPTEHYVVLRYLCAFLKEVASHCEENRMTSTNLAGLFAPHILRCSDSDPNIEASSMEIITRTLDAFITHHETLFVEPLKKADDDRKDDVTSAEPDVVCRTTPKRPPPPTQYFSIPATLEDSGLLSEDTGGITDTSTPSSVSRLYPSLGSLFSAQQQPGRLSGSGYSEDSEEMTTMQNIRSMSQQVRQLVSDTRRLTRERDEFQARYHEESLTSARLRREVAYLEGLLVERDREVVRLRQLLLSSGIPIGESIAPVDVEDDDEEMRI